jgi:ABC-2 type transport system permease protein
MTPSPAAGASAPQISAEQRIATSPRTSRLGALWTLYILALRQHLHGRRWIVLALLFLLLAGLAVIIRVTGSDVPGRLLEFVLLWLLVPQAILPLVALLYASGVIQDEQEEQTITYILLRPISKWMIYIVKMLAMWTTSVLLVTLLTVITFLAVYVNSKSELGDATYRVVATSGILSLAVVAYCGLFGLMSLLTRRILVFGVLYAALVEGLLASLPLSVRMITIIYYTRLLAYRALDFVVTWPRGRTDDVAANAWFFDTSADPGLAEHPQLRTCVLVLVGVALVSTAIGAAICTQREFHVKTPEKG